ncbi:MAG: tRNA pseudouridine(38-40) synthase TruA [Dysgonamonadaceae bacterium]|jgi:tRNA pseudouridine38-40 synthase|nr:tRNA pseudouridine(38-40) synthase TruA [Dysgonamonadaceae bacterium]
MNRFFIYLSYNGGNYCGWQNQPNGVSVQQKIEESLQTLLRRPVPITGAGRTDAGVHAKQMVAHFDWEDTDIETLTLADKLNRILPKDISISKIVRVAPDAHARFDALSRTYKYYITDRKDPFLYPFHFKMKNLPDFEKMNEAAKILFEYQDFTSFSKLHTDVKTNNCKIMEAQWLQTGDVWEFTITADRFLRNMVRAIVGTLIEVGRGKMTLGEFRQVIETKSRSAAGSSVPGNALFLTEIKYPENIFLFDKVQL